MSYDLIIVGSGAAGLSAAVYSGRYRMNTLVIGDEFGGYTSIAGPIENYPGYSSIDGFDLMVNMKKQATDLGIEIRDGRVEDIRRTESGCFAVRTKKGEEFFSNTLVIATGTEHRRLGIPNEKELTGKGVHYCVTCDGPLYGGKTIAVVGGGDSSIKGVNLAAEYAKKIYLIVRGTKVSAEPINYERMQRLGDKVEVLFETEVKEIVGEGKFEKAVLSKPVNGSTDLAVDGLFIEVGLLPRSELLKKAGIDLDEKGYAQADQMMRTNVPGAFVAGDIFNLFEGFRQDITAAAMGAVAATSAYEYYKIHGDLCKLHGKAPDGIG
ncbi:FAD-dependent oxidoreductase [Candidatus Uhrbacteria bacterium]|nr:FAD-dependent oxidoreductase [Candidatus Uhrbacteria bacterium]